MKISNVLRVVGRITGCLILIFFIFYYVIPIYNFKNADSHMQAITHAIVNGSEEKLNDELESRNKMKLISDSQFHSFIEFAKANKNKEVKSVLVSSDNILISVVNDSVESRLVLGQDGFLARWQLVNVLFLRK